MGVKSFFFFSFSLILSLEKRIYFSSFFLLSFSESPPPLFFSSFPYIFTAFFLRFLFPPCNRWDFNTCTQLARRRRLFSMKDLSRSQFFALSLSSCFIVLPPSIFSSLFLLLSLLSSFLLTLHFLYSVFRLFSTLYFVLYFTSQLTFFLFILVHFFFFLSFFLTSYFFFFLSFPFFRFLFYFATSRPHFSLLASLGGNCTNLPS